MIRPLTIYCPAHDLEAGVACPVPGGACADRIVAARTGNPVRDLWRAMAGAAVEAASDGVPVEIEPKGDA